MDPVRSAFALLLAAAAGAALGFWLRGASAGPSVPDADVDRQAREPTARDAEIAALRRELEQLRAAAAAPTPQRAAVAPPSVPADSPDPPADGRPPPPPASAAELHALACLRNLLPDRFAAATLAELRTLAELDLRGTKVNDDDLAAIAALPNLRSLGLRGTAITDQGVRSLHGFHGLEVLELRGTAVTGAGLTGLPITLVHVDLTDTQAGATGYCALPSLPSLATLKLNRLPVTDQEVDAIARWPSLTHVEIDGTAVTAAGVRRLIELLPHLTRLEVRGTGLSDELLAELRARHPRLDLAADSGFVPGAHGR
jgi:hypothetical protein